MKKMNYRSAQSLLDKNPLQNLPALKHIHLLKDRAEYHIINKLLTIEFSPQMTPHDSHDYPKKSLISLVSRLEGDDRDRKKDFTDYLENLPSGFLIKSSLPFDESFSLERIASFSSLTCKGLSDQISKIVPLPLIPKENKSDLDDLFSLMHYSRKDIKKMIEGGGQVFIEFNKQKPCALCLAYPNYGNIWEVGALAVHPDFRRRGLGMKVVSSATDWLLAKGMIPRYHVNSRNKASIKLAASCGYEKLLEYNHYSLREN